MSNAKTLSSTKKAVLAGFLVFVALFVITQYLSYQRYLINSAAQQREISNVASAAKERLRTSLNYSFAATKTLAFIVERYGDPEDFDAIAKNLLETSKFIDAIQLVKGGEIIKVYPLRGNESVIGYNILQDTATNKEALKAIEKNKLFFSGPFELKQGGMGVVGRQPIFKNNEFWGFAAVIIRLPTLLQAAGIENNENKNYEFQLSKINPNTNKEEFFLPNAEKFKKEHFSILHVPDGEWNLYVKHRNNDTLNLSIAFVLLGILLAITGGRFTWYFMRQPYILNILVNEKTQQLQESENNFSTMLARISDAFVSLDTNWSYTYMNQKAGELFNRDPKKMVGKNIWTEFPEGIGQPFQIAYERAMREQKYVQIEEYYPPYNKWFENNIYPSPSGLSIYFKDITEKKQAEEKIKASKEQLQLIYDSVSDSLFLMDVLPKGKYKIISINKSFTRSTGLTNEQVLNKYIDEIIPEPSLQMVLKNYAEVVREKQIVEWEETTSYPTGVKTGMVYMSPVLNEEGKCVQLLGVVHDITEQKIAETEILAMNEQLRSLSGHLQNIREEERTHIARDIHDDLGQQLTGLKFALTALKNKNEKELHLTLLTERTNDMIGMVNTAVVSVRRIAKELRPSVLDDLGLEAAIEWNAKEYEERTGIKTNLESKLGEQNFSKDINTAVFRIFQESLTNITRHSEANEVDVKLFIQENNLVLVIIDNGIGISDERKNNRSSLGLLGMNERATYLGGTFTIEKHQEGGTIVTVKIPIKI
ncbi:MAG: PAS domain-containing protein [Bacteroidota bacterium]